MKRNLLRSPSLFILLSSASLMCSDPKKAALTPPHQKLSDPTAESSAASPNGTSLMHSPASTPASIISPALQSSLLVSSNRRASAPPPSHAASSDTHVASHVVSPPPPLTLGASANQPSSATSPEAPNRHLSPQTSARSATASALTSPLLRPLSVGSAPHRSGQTEVTTITVVATSKSSLSRRRSSTHPSPAFGPAKAPDLIANSRIALARFAEAMANELAVIDKELKEREKSTKESSPLTPKSLAVIERDLAICRPTANAASYLKLDDKTKKAALFPQTPTDPAANTAAATK